MRNTLMMSDLPEDLLEEILCRVPATSLKQLRSTCKRWNYLFNNGRFTRKLFDKAPKQFLNLMLKESKVCSMSISFNGIPSAEATGEFSLVEPLSSLGDQFEISKVSHCDGLLLCTNVNDTRIVVWNPCTGQTRWIESINLFYYYAFGSYANSYKILGYGQTNQELAIYEINSHSWRFLHIIRDCTLLPYTNYGVSLKGNTYWFASDEKEKQLGVFLVSFDYTTETFGRLRLPCQCPSYHTASLSVVREEKLAVLLQREYSSKTEIWVTSKIGETKVVSWSMVLAVDFPPELLWSGVSFVVDEEKKVIVCCDKYFGKDAYDGKNLVHVVGEDNKVREVYFGVAAESSWPFLTNYVPSLIQIRETNK